MAIGMTVGELIGQLKAMDPKAVLVVSSNSEGNDYSPLSLIYKANYFPLTNWSGEVYDYDKDAQGVDELSAVVLQPVN